MKLTVSSVRVVQILTVVVLFLLLASITVRVANFVVESYWGVDDPLGTIRSILDVASTDASIPAWYSSATLGLCSALLAVIATAKRRRNDRYAIHWGFLSAIFLLLSIDEVARLHETTGYIGYYVAASMSYTPTGIIYFFWVVPGTILVLVILLTYLKFLAHLPKNTLLLFLVAGALFVGGSLGLELFESREAFLNSSGDRNSGDMALADKVWRLLLAWIEEGLEMLGVLVFVYALLLYIASYVKDVTIQINN